MRSRLSRRALLVGLAATACAERGLVVFAAASLREVIDALGARLVARGGPPLRASYGGSGALRAQIELGARADVFASADAASMEPLVAAGLVVDARVLARNEPVLIVPRGAASIRSFEDLPRARRVVLGGPDVPIGRYSAVILERAAARWGAAFRADVEAHVASRELDVRHVLAKVALGEADAGIVYRTDASADVDVIPIPAGVSVVAEYWIARGASSTRAADASAFLALAASEEGRQLLEARGFLAAR